MVWSRGHDLGFAMSSQWRRWCEGVMTMAWWRRLLWCYVHNLICCHGLIQTRRNFKIDDEGRFWSSTRQWRPIFFFSLPRFTSLKVWYHGEERWKEYKVKNSFPLILFCTKAHIYIQKILAPKLRTFLTQLQLA